MQDSVSKAERYRKEANKYGELAKYAQPAYLGDFYRKVAVRYAFMAQDLLRQPDRNTKVVVGDAQSSSQPSLIEQEIRELFCDSNPSRSPTAKL